MSTYRYKNIPPIQSFVAGIGQRRMLIEDFVRIYEILERRASSNSINEETLFYGVKGIDL
jgi:hypothetical protein